LSKANFFDVLVVGAGAAGLYAVLCLRKYGLRVGLITKEAFAMDDSADSASKWAQGGIAAAIDPTDSPVFHGADTLKAGADLCEPEAVQVLVNQAPQCIHTLEQWGVQFDRHSGRFALTLEAAHSHHRVLHVADSTGKALVTALKAQVLADRDIVLWQNTPVVDLLVQEGQCYGLRCAVDGQLVSLASRAVVLATGGYAQLFAQNTNPPASTGDGIVIAWRAGARVRDLEFVQFHPTALAVSGAPRFLISEAVRGEGAKLVNHRGERFTEELAPRDVVSREIFHYLQTTGDPTVFLDLSPIPVDRVHKRFPNIIKVCHQWGIDPLHQPIPVTPAAHYCMGGIETDTWGRTSLQGLYAVGETASTGVHGANRLASNSLLECFVFGERLAQHISEFCPQIAMPDCRPMAVELEAPLPNFRHIKTAVQSLCWENAGIVRDQSHLETALAQITQWQKPLEKLASLDRAYLETRHLTALAWLVINAALWRKESRGAHYRKDYPHSDPRWQVHSSWTGCELTPQPLNSALISV
jgi:L-aspartate oxidase